MLAVPYDEKLVSMLLPTALEPLLKNEGTGDEEMPLLVEPTKSLLKLYGDGGARANGCCWFRLLRWLNRSEVPLLEPTVDVDGAEFCFSGQADCCNRCLISLPMACVAGLLGA